MAKSIHPAPLLALLLAGLAADATAQDPSPTTERRAAPCAPRTSRAARPCEPTTTVVVTEHEATFSLELPERKTLQCAATMEIVYTQRDTVASVEGAIDTRDCAAADGEHRLNVTVRDENRELTTLEFSHAWRRGDDQPLSFKADYPIGANVDLVSVRSRQLRCTCAAAKAAAATPDPQP